MENQVQKVQTAESREDVQQVPSEVRQRGVPHVVPPVFNGVENLSQMRRAVERVVQRLSENDFRERWGRRRFAKRRR